MDRARLALALLALALAGACDVRREGSEERVIDPSRTVSCALGGEGRFAPDCTFERSKVGAQRLLVIHHPDGSFRRFEQVTDGRGLIAADGADSVTITPLKEMVEVAVADDRYLLPATFRSQ